MMYKLGRVFKVCLVDRLHKKWHETNIIQILRNEKYKGDTLLQKTYTVDFLTKKRVKNNGIVQSYYIPNSHEPIVSEEDFAAVQAEFKRRTSIRGYSSTGKNQYGCKYPFSGMLFCYHCGAKLQRNCWVRDKKNVYIWKCTNKSLNGLEACSAKDIKELDLEAAFVRTMKRAIVNEKEFLQKLLENIKVGITNVEEEFTSEQLDEKLNELTQEMMGLVRLNARAGEGCSEYEAEFIRVSAEMDKVKERKEALLEAELAEVMRRKRIDEMEKFLTSTETPLEKFDAALFRRLVEKVIIHSFVEATFIFRSGIELKEILG
jgi:site-specific DNA recombinase